MANNLDKDKKVMAVSMLCEGSSIRAIERVTGIHRDTIMRLGVRMGKECFRLHEEKMKNIASTRIEIDEIWGFVGKKKANTDCGRIFCEICTESPYDHEMNCPAFLLSEDYSTKSFDEDSGFRILGRISN